MQEEIFPLVDEDGKVIGKAPRSRCHNGSKLLHPVVHLHIFNTEGKLFLQKRSALKDIQPDKWDTAVAGHINLDETPAQAVRREAYEELGLLDIEPLYLSRYIIETDVERELNYCYYAIYDQNDFVFDKQEVADGRFWSIDELRRNIENDLFTPNFIQDFTAFLHDGLMGLKKSVGL